MALFFVFCQREFLAQSVGINSTGDVPDASAILDIKSTSKGMLLPRLADTSSVTSPALGLFVFSNSDSSFYYYNGLKWVFLTNNERVTEMIESNSNSEYSSGTIFCDNVVTAVVDVFNPTTGKTWMDRNLGAVRAATSSADYGAYGDLYQWGRGADRHHCRDSPSLSEVSNSDQPGNGYFFTRVGSTSPYDWRSPKNDDLWQGEDGTNNPCPSGYRLPTNTELEAERLSWSSNNAAGAYASPLKWTVAGNRNYSSANFADVGSNGHYWSSSIFNGRSYYLTFGSSSASSTLNQRTYAYSIRCIKD